jgi:hypothetical protein
MMFWRLGDDPDGVLLAAIHCGLAGGPSAPECVATGRERP